MFTDEGPDLAPEDFLQVVFRRSGGGIDLGVVEAFNKPGCYPARTVAFSHGVCRLRNRNRVITDRFHHGLHVVRVLLAELILTEPYWIVLVGLKARSFASELKINGAQQIVEELDFL